MPSITYNGQSFSIDGRRLWVLGAAIQYARVPPALWAERIAAAKQAGFNTIQTSCPWTVHEPRSGRFVFDGEADVRKFIQSCGAAGMRVIVRVGPFVGDHFDGGGLPGWLIETPDIRLRENNSTFLEHVSRYFRRLLGEIADLQVTSSPSGPILLVQSEHAWTCTNEEQAEGYLHDVTRFIRESGITVPVINANDLWQDTPGTIDTWRGFDHLLAHLRQLRTVQPDAPRLVSAFDAADVALWGDSNSTAGARKSANAVLRRLAEVFAAGAQPIVAPFHAGTNFDFLAGRIAGRQDGFVATAAAVDPPLGQTGARGEKYHAIRRLITFASHFSHVFAEFDPDYQPIVADPEDATSGAPHSRGRSSKSHRVAGPVVVAQRGAQGRIVFVFAGDDSKVSDVPLVLDDGVRLPVQIGDQPVAWFALDVDLQGLGRLDYSNISPWAIIDRSIVVFHGPAGAMSYISISGTPLETPVPTDEAGAPTVIEHRGLTIVICNQAQIDAAYHTDKAMYVGIDGFEADGTPRPHPIFAKAYVVRRNAEVEELEHDTKGATKRRGSESSGRRAEKLPLSQWQFSPSSAHIAGTSPRFASLEGPQSLSECGAPSGYGWYRVRLKGSGRRLCHAPHAADRLHLFIDGQRQQVFGAGPGADARPFQLRLNKGETTLIALADNLGRFSEGNDLSQCKGLWGHIYEVKPLRVGKPKIVEARPVDPFELRGFIAGRGVGHLSDSRQAVWSFSYPRRSPLLIDVNGARTSGTWVLNDRPIAYYSGATGACLDRIVIDPAKEKSLKRGKNVLRFAPDARQEKSAEDIIKFTTIYECVNVLSDTAGSGGWAFAKWEPPPISSYDEFNSADARSIKGVPCWWRSTFTLEKPNGSSQRLPLWLNTAGLSKGQAYINGENLGRFFTATASGKAVGDAARLYIPEPWLRPGHTNEVVIFDEHGCTPGRVSILRAPEQPVV